VTIARGPCTEREPRLAELARRRGEDLEFLRRELADFIETESRIVAESRIVGDGRSEPWLEPVDAKTLLKDVLAEIRRYVVVDDDVAITVALFTLFAWVHDIATHSPNLLLTSAEPDSGKTTLSGVLQFLLPRPVFVTAVTAASIFRIIEDEHPTVVVDNAEDVFVHNPKLVAVIDGGWTKGAKIPRAERGGHVRYFSVFCPKLINMRGLNLIDTTATRCIVCTMWPKLPDENVSDFDYADNDTFVTLRRKAARWSEDSMPALKAATPELPPDFDNRVRQNWKLLLAIAEQAGVGKQARAAAVKLSGKLTLPSPGVRLVRAVAGIHRAVLRIGGHGEATGF
jgi:Protein of unknown function (DUF3631)